MKSCSLCIRERERALGSYKTQKINIMNVTMLDGKILFLQLLKLVFSVGGVFGLAGGQVCLAAHCCHPDRYNTLTHHKAKNVDKIYLHTAFPPHTLTNTFRHSIHFKGGTLIHAC